MSTRVTQSSPNRASGSSFYAAMRILPRPRREAMYAIYGFCREVDDIADSTAPRAERLKELAAWRADIHALYGGQMSARTHDLAEPVRSFRLDEADFLSVIDGMEMDVRADIRAPAWDDLDIYCDRVASAVGRLSVRIFGLDAHPGRKLAHHLGRALQLTNILRDLDEDAAAGRLYLPREAIERAGIATGEPATALASPALDQACAQLVKAARFHFDEAGAIMAACPRRAVRAPRIMGEVYRLMLAQMVARGFAAPRRPVRLSRLRLVWILARYAVI
jgi:squalene synthase HpnD